MMLNANIAAIALQLAERLIARKILKCQKQLVSAKPVHGFAKEIERVETLNYNL